jgi:hypothetical protein
MAINARLDKSLLLLRASAKLLLHVSAAAVLIALCAEIGRS